MRRTAKTPLLVTPEYRQFVDDLKARVAGAHLSAARSVNRELILLYWDIGRGIVERQRALGWGESVVEMVSADLRRAFPGIKGFSVRNLWYMRRLFETYATPEILPQVVGEMDPGTRAPILQQPVAELGAIEGRPRSVLGHGHAKLILPQLVAEVPWGHHVLILDRLTHTDARLYYLRATAQFGWSRNVLLNQIKGRAYERAVTERKSHNFPLALPEQLAEQANEMLKSSYNLEFLGLSRAVKERELEERLASRLQAFLLELGYGFCFIGRQYRVSLGTKEYFIDLLFYHRFLRSLVAFDLKVGPFEPEHAGKMDFYLSLLNDRENAPEDRPAIGVILCAEKDDVEVEYALRGKRSPIGVAVYQLQSKLPAILKGKMPTARQLADVVRAAIPEDPDR